jgi:DNA-binding MarR family transcriptional regulator
MLDRLERGCLIERRPNPRDRRRTHIFLTPAGKEKLDALFASLRKGAERILSGYRADELDLLADFFEKISNVWTEERKKLQSK